MIEEELMGGGIVTIYNAITSVVAGVGVVGGDIGKRPAVAVWRLLSNLPSAQNRARRACALCGNKLRGVGVIAFLWANIACIRALRIVNAQHMRITSRITMPYIIICCGVALCA